MFHHHSEAEAAHGSETHSGNTNSGATWLSQCTGNKKALLVGVNYTLSDIPLSGCQSDVDRMQKFLASQYAFPQSSILVLKDDPSLGPSLQPTRENIINAMRWLVRDAQPHDSLFFHYSGHGGQTIDRSGDEKDYYDSCIYPVDSIPVKGADDAAKQRAYGNLIIDDDLHTLLVSPLPTGCRLTAIADSCHSGSVLDLPFMYSAKDGKLKHQAIDELSNKLAAEKDTVVHEEEQKALDIGAMISGVSHILMDSGRKLIAEQDVKGAKESLSHLHVKQMREHMKSVREGERKSESWADVVLISGCKDTQTSADAVEGGVPTGALSWAFMDVLDNEKDLTYLQLLDRIREKLRKGKYDQRPQLSTGHPIVIEDVKFFA